VLQDIRIAFRLLARTPAWTAIALLSIALSIGATAVVFTIGLASALILLQLLRSTPLGLATIEPALVTISVSLVAITASIACFIPARRATKIDPMSALK